MKALLSSHVQGLGFRLLGFRMKGLRSFEVFRALRLGFAFGAFSG